MSSGFWETNVLEEDQKVRFNKGVELCHNNNLRLSTTDTGVDITSGTSGDCILNLISDTDNNNENDNPQIIMTQDGGIKTAAIFLANINDLSLGSSASSILLKTNPSVGAPLTGTTRFQIDENGKIFMYGLPTTDPTTANQLWNSLGTLKISSG